VKPVRIGVDARELLGATTGVGRYLGELLLRWTSRPDRDSRRFLLYSPEPLPIRLPAGAVDHRVVARGAAARPLNGGRGTWWEQVHLRRAVMEDRPDVFFAPAYTAPFLPAIPLALTIHDIAFVAHPEWFRIREGFRRRWLTRLSADAASVILTDSEFSRSEIHTHFHIDRSRIHVVPPGIAPRHAVDSRGARWPGRDPLVLYVGSIFNRRRVTDLIAAFARVSHDVPEARLAIVGEDRSWPPLSLPDVVASHGVEARVDLKNYVTEEELALLYGRAAVFAFLSEYEGFGLTPLEALAAGIPIVVLDTPVAREVYGSAAHYVPPDDVRATADMLIRLLRRPEAGAAVMRHAPETLARYSWERCASLTLQKIEEVAR
jgi:glycosyltransferase involved in cell wall biosynthesis